MSLKKKAKSPREIQDLGLDTEKYPLHSDWSNSRMAKTKTPTWKKGVWPMEMER